MTEDQGATSPSPSYLLACRLCGGGDLLILPFGSAADRGKWAAAHRDGTGHDSWWCHDVGQAEVADRGSSTVGSA